MSDADPSAPIPPAKDKSSELQGMDPGELLARGLHTVKPSGGAGWEPPTPEEVGRLLPQYRIEKLIGRGGMGAVYKGIQLNLDRPVAIKLLPVEVAADAQFVTRFEREARTLARLQHSRIITIHDFGKTSEGHLYFVMEYIDGTNLREILRGPGLNPEQALLVVGQLCDALQAAHREGIVHRDIKPENVLISRDGYVKLVDFGLSRPPQEVGVSQLTQTNIVMGTPDYMAPEQHEGTGKADHRSDIFALGVMFYEMLTGKTPRGVFDPPSRKVQVDVRIDEVVLKALQSEPERRYQQASEMKTDVERIRTTPLPSPAKRSPAKPSPARPSPARPSPAKASPPKASPVRLSPVKAPLPQPKSKRFALLALGMAALLVLVGFAGYALWPKFTHPTSPPVAVASLDKVAGDQTKVRSPSVNPTPEAMKPATPSSMKPATPSPYTVAEKEALEKALLSHVWTWKGNELASFPWKEIVFWKDGTMTTTTPEKAHWSITGPHAVALQFDGGNRITLTFFLVDSEFYYFTGRRDDGKNMVSGTISPSREVSATQGAPATPAPIAKLTAPTEPATRPVQAAPPPAPQPRTISQADLYATPTPSRTPPRYSSNTTPAKTPSSQLASFVEQLPGAKAWAVAPLDIKAPSAIRENAALLKTGLTAEGTRSTAAWRPVYVRGLSVADMVIGALQERETDSAHGITPQQWTVRSSQIRAMLDGDEMQFRNALQAAGGFPAFTGTVDPSLKVATFPPVPALYSQMDPAIFRQGLTSFRWSWNSTGNEGPKSVQFHQNGKVTCSSGEGWHWEATGVRTATCIWGDRQRPAGYMFLVFDKDMNGFECHDKGWAVVVRGQRLKAAGGDEPGVGVGGVGPAGTNFGWGDRKLTLHVSVNCGSDDPFAVGVDCYWVGWDGKHHTTSAPFHKNVTVYADHSVNFDVTAVAERTNGATFGILAPAPGVYRGWIISVHDATGKRVASAANMPEFHHLVP